MYLQRDDVALTLTLHYPYLMTAQTFQVYDGADDGQVETVLRGIMGRDKMHLWKLMDQLLLLGA
jgi:hypothetical protein